MNKYFFKRKQLKRLQEKIWEREINISMQEDFLKEADVSLGKIKNMTGLEKEFLAGIEDSHKKEDRENKRMTLKRIEDFNKQYKAQEEEIKKSKEMIMRERMIIIQMEKHIVKIKEF